MKRATCWPTRADRHLLRSALLEPSRARADFAAWLSEVEFDQVDPARQALLPLVSHNLGSEELPPRVAGRMRGLRRRAWAINQLNADHVRRVLAALAARDIRPLLFKGLPLAFSFYPSPGTRGMSDVDLWVPPESTSEAMTALLDAGFRPSPELLRWPPVGQPGWPFVHESGACIDLHAHVLAAACYSSADAAFLERAVPTTLLGAPALVPDPADHLLILISHGLRWNPVPPLRWAADAILLARGTRVLDWSRLVEIAARLRLSAAAAAGLRWLAEHLEFDVPRDVLPALARGSGAAERIELRVLQRAPDGVLGALPQMFVSYSRQRAGCGARPTLRGFVRYLAATWGAEGRAELARLALDKARRRLRSALAP